MKQVAVLLAILAACSATFDKGLRVKFNYGFNPGIDFFFDLPWNVTNALTNNWTEVERPTSPLSTLVMYCPSELVICVLFDPATNHTAGVQIAIPESYFTGSVFNSTVQGFIPWTVQNNSESITFLTKQLYFISEVTLNKTTEERQEIADANIILQEDAVWPVGFNQERMSVPTTAAGISESNFTEQACIPWMGRHHYYNMSALIDCLADTILNWFPLTDGDELIGMGFLTVGLLSETAPGKKYFEAPPKLAVQAIVPRGPECLYELAENPTITTMHVYFIDKPWTVGCWSY